MNLYFWLKARLNLSLVPIVHCATQFRPRHYVGVCGQHDSRGKNLGTQRTEGWVDPTDSLDAVVKPDSNNK
jgi:hypothetical protein